MKATNRYIFDDCDYMPSTLTDRSEPMTANDAEPQFPEPTTVKDTELVLNELELTAIDIDNGLEMSPSIFDEINHHSLCKTPTPVADMDLVPQQYNITLISITLLKLPNTTYLHWTSDLYLQ